MDFIEEIRNLSTKIEKQKDFVQSEEATKNAFVMPFIKLLGYDIFNPTEVVPEFTADIGTKQGEKVDYAIFKDSKVVMIIECKKFGTDLSNAHISQLYRYFSPTHARIAVLTDGALYRFYTDLEKLNIMDTRPFLEFNLLNIQQPLINELKRFTKSDFNLSEVLTAARDLRYTKEIRRIMTEQLKAPTEEFVQFFLSSVYSGVRTQEVDQQFTDIVKRAWTQFLDEQINQRLSSNDALPPSPDRRSSSISSTAIPSSSLSNKSTAGEVESLNEHQKSKSRRKGLIVIFPDGTVFSSERDSKNQTEVWVKTIKKLLAQFGGDRLMEADLKTRLPHSKDRILSTDSTFRDAGKREIPSTAYRENDTTYFITHDYRAERKKELLENISNALGAGLKVDISQ